MPWAVCGRDAVTRVLGTMEAANKVIYREGRVHRMGPARR